MTEPAGDPVYITTPIYYVNDAPHIGHAYTTIAADALARYFRAEGRRVFFLTGTDEHGLKVDQAARARGVDPKAHCDEYVERFRGLWPILGISNDAFLRTTDAAHEAVVRDVLSRLHAAGVLERRAYRGWYCTPCERYWTEKDLAREGAAALCPDCRRGVEPLEEPNWFFPLARFGGGVAEAIRAGRMRVLPEGRRNEALAFLDRPLEDLCLTRPKARLSWGIEVPFDPDFVTWVWFDALFNYYSAAAYLAPPLPEGSWWPATYQLIGKDILTTHAVYWPAWLRALGLDLPRTIVAHGWWTIDGEKMSKSLGNAIDPYALVARHGADAFRYFLLREVPFGADGNFSERALVERANADLANDLGNLAARVLSLLERHAGGRVPDARGGGAGGPLAAAAAEALAEVRDRWPRCDFQGGLVAVWELVRAANRFVDAARPWDLAKDPAKRRALEETLYAAAEALRHAAALVAPTIPVAADGLGRRLGLEAAPALSGLTWGGLEPGRMIHKGEALFPRREFMEATGTGTSTLQAKLIRSESAPSTAAATSRPAAASAPTIADASIDDFGRLDLRVARVLSAERVPKADRLLRLEVDLGGERRTLVAGIATRYRPEDLVGKSVVVVANLAARRIRGVESRGMILAADSPDGPVLLAPAGEAAPGAKVK